MARILKPPTSYPPMELWYRKPAPDTTAGWEAWALPLGCGYLGAKVLGGVESERIQITENSLANPYRPGLNNFAETYIDFPHCRAKHYRRSLSLDDAVARVEYDCDGVRYTREYFASYPDRVLVMRFSSSKPGSISFTLRPEIPYICDCHSEPGDGMGKSGQIAMDRNTIRLTGQMAYYQINFEGQYRVFPEGGAVTRAGQTLRVAGADRRLRPDQGVPGGAEIWGPPPHLPSGRPVPRHAHQHQNARVDEGRQTDAPAARGPQHRLGDGAPSERLGALRGWESRISSLPPAAETRYAAQPVGHSSAFSD